MVELSLQVEKEQMKADRVWNQNDAIFKGKVKQLKIVCSVLLILFVGAMIYCLSFINEADYMNGALTNTHKRVIYGYVTGAVFLIDSVLLLYWTFKLIKTLKKDFDDNLKEETSTLKCLCFLYFLSYLVRTVLLLTQGYIPKAIGQLATTPRKALFINYMLFFNSFYFWDLLPILMNLIMHHRNFKE